MTGWTVIPIRALGLTRDAMGHPSFGIVTTGSAFLKDGERLVATFARTDEAERVAQLLEEHGLVDLDTLDGAL